MEVNTFTYHVVDELYSNAYILVDKQNCIVIDPSKNYSGLVDFIKSRKLTLKAVLLTHTHFDHMQGVDLLVDTFHVPLYLMEEDIPGLTDLEKNCCLYNPEPISIIIKSPAIGLYDQEQLNILSSPIKVIHTPFHTIGSCCFYLEKEKILFSGDTLFKYVVGRTDLPTSVPKEIYNSLRKIKDLPDDVIVYPGHGIVTNMGNEKRFNKFLKNA